MMSELMRGSLRYQAPELGQTSRNLPEDNAAVRKGDVRRGLEIGSRRAALGVENVEIVLTVLD